MASSSMPFRPEAQPAYERLQDQGAFYRRRVSVPREASLVHRVLAPIAEELGGRVHDDDGRALIEWLEQFWPYEIAGHGRSDGFRWFVIGSTLRASVLVLITQSLLGARSEFLLDVIVVPLHGTLGAAPRALEGSAKVSVRTTREGVHFWTQGELAALDGDEELVRAPVRAGITAIETTLASGATRTAQRVTRARSRPLVRQWAMSAGLVLAVLLVGLFADRGLAEMALGSFLIVVMVVCSAFLPKLRGRSVWYLVKRAAGQSWRRRDEPLRASRVDRRIARLEEGRDIPNSLGDG